MIEVYIDGASAGNPGPSGIGILIKGNGIHKRISHHVGEMNNHMAEYQAFLHAIRYCKQQEFTMVSFRSDSQAVVNAVEKGFAKKEYKEILSIIMEELRTSPLYFIKWIPSKENTVADQLARAGIKSS